MKKVLLFCAASLVGFTGASVSAQTDSDRILQRGVDAQRLGRDMEAFQWFKVAAEEGNAEGQYHLGYCYLTGQGTTLNDKLARFWFLKAADQGDGKSEKYLGSIYENGWGVPPDLGAAKGWYQKALQNGCKSAQTDLSRLEQLASPTPSPAQGVAAPTVETAAGNNGN